MTMRFATIGLLLGMLCCGTGARNPTRTVVAVDFGAPDRSGPWQVVSDPTGAEAYPLKTLSGEPSGIVLTIPDDFADVNRYGCRRTASDLGLPVAVSGDSFWGNAAVFQGRRNPTGKVRLTGLTQNRIYSIDVYASRTSDEPGRITQYVLAGDTAVLDAANNVADRVRLEAIPDSTGVLTLEVSAGPGNTTEQQFFYLGAMVISWEEGPKAPAVGLRLLAPSGGERWQPGAEVRIAWENTTGDSVRVRLEQAGAQTLLATLPPTAADFHWRIPAERAAAGSARIVLEAGAASARQPDELTIAHESTDIRPIVVIGSSTAAGAGASSPDSAWVARYRRDLASVDTRFPVVNLAKGGYTTRHLKPAGEGVDSLRNITMALSLKPAAVVVNLPSNDAAMRIPFAETWANFEAMAAAASAAQVPLWVATTQPRNAFDTDQTELQHRTRRAIEAHFGDRALDFWTGLATSSGEVEPAFDAGDGVHLTDAGHRLLFERVRAAGIPDETSASPPPEGWTVEVDDSIRVNCGHADPVDYRWVSADGELLVHGRAAGPRFAVGLEASRLDAVGTLHLSDAAGGGGVWRVWVWSSSAARPRRAENSDR